MTNVRRTGYVAGMGLVMLILAAGCSALFTNQRAVNLQDVVFLTRHGLSNEVIKKHIEQTNSRFDITTEDLAALKDEGVDDEVIAFLVERSGPQPLFASEYVRPIFPGTSFYYRPPVYQMYIPIYESYTGYYPSPYPMYRPQIRQPGLIGRFYEYPEHPSMDENNDRRDNNASGEAGPERSDRNGADSEQADE